MGALASGHTPLMSVPGELWSVYAQRDSRNRELVQVPTGRRVSFDELLASANPAIASEVDEEAFKRKFQSIQGGLQALRQRFSEISPDVVVMFGDDQSELFFDDNYPQISIYWGETMKMLPRVMAPDASDALRIAMASYGDRERDYPIDSELALHLIEQLQERECDISHSRYLRSEYGGSIGPSTWYLDSQFETEDRPFGMPHAFSYPITNWFDGKEVPIVPITINTCYPPNWISPPRAYNLGLAVREIVDSWESDKRVVFACSGGVLATLW
ncbi:MAG: hypothetical protein GEU75_07050 [Dehalococcoidia bacterium]|nr:hypothetical protein [Dehalococcoidia bacterium]